jgi:hypothetical protein
LIFLYLNKDFHFESVMEVADEIVCILLNETDKYKSSFGVELLEKIAGEKEKRIILLNSGE